MAYRLNSKVTLAVILVVLSVLIVLVQPYERIHTLLEANQAWLLIISLLFSEALFIAGIIVMASVVGHDLGKNPLKWRHHVSKLAKKAISHTIFWLGFWLNAIGAVSTTLLLSVATIRYLPKEAAPLLGIALFDLFTTFALRREIISITKDINR